MSRRHKLRRKQRTGLSLFLVIAIAIAAAVVVPRDLREASALLFKTAAVLINLAAGLHQRAPEPDGADVDEPGEHDSQHNAGLRAGVLLQPVVWRHFRGTPMPQGRGCRVTHCEKHWDHDRQRPFRRCYWRCPKPESKPQYEAPRREIEPITPPRQYEASGPQITLPEMPPELLFGLFLIGLLLVVSFLSSNSTQDIDEAFDEAAAAAAAKAKLDAATAEADAIVARFRARSRTS